jgi:hypothetical protein
MRTSSVAVALLAALLTVLLSGCSNSDSGVPAATDTTEPPQPQRFEVFKPAVAGIHFKSSKYDGFTGLQGEFPYDGAKDPLTLSVGNSVLATVGTGGINYADIHSPLEFGTTVLAANNMMAYLLMLDDGDRSNGLQIPLGLHQALLQVPGVDFNNPDFLNSIQPQIQVIKNFYNRMPLLMSAADGDKYLRPVIQCDQVGNYDGTNGRPVDSKNPLPSEVSITTHLVVLAPQNEVIVQFNFPNKLHGVDSVFIRDGQQLPYALQPSIEWIVQQPIAFNASLQLTNINHFASGRLYDSDGHDNPLFASDSRGPVFNSNNNSYVQPFTVYRFNGFFQVLDTSTSTLVPKTLFIEIDENNKISGQVYAFGNVESFSGTLTADTLDAKHATGDKDKPDSYLAATLDRNTLNLTGTYGPKNGTPVLDFRQTPVPGCGVNAPAPNLL